ncbi:hypothetical protein AUJ95_07330 [Candidatus Desantisbacteria bacterium CG2_30_40_21]|uniref:DUF5723 domain-containing protein n=1 Tax=Candidatus Desantisbacteria bacterium CG2_30_40_21 TaxID=1817895 RepID=A0A1J5DPG5_9BACT|nr:MAG: hypothetical protein AUJ95_07330 [Candidatus Desantisbacteria bacterium CG2_30_40_21]
MKKSILTLAFIVSCACSAGAEQWQILGTRPMGMGGAFVAVAQGPMAQYWNPGGLAMAFSDTVSGVELPITAGVEITGDVMKNASAIGDMASKFTEINAAQKNGSATNASQISAFVKTITLLDDMNDSGKGAMFEVAGGANFKFSKVAVSVNNFTTIGLNPFVDVNNIGLGAVTVTGTTSGGITMSGVTATSTTDSGYNSARDTIATAITKLGGLSAISNLICGTSTGITVQNSDITNETTLANALVNQAITNNLSVAQVTDAANQLNTYATDAKPIIENAVAGNSYTNNQSNLTVDMVSFVEIAFGYGKFMKFLDGLSIGGNLKMINGNIGHDKFKFMQQSDTEDAFKTDMDTKSSWAPAIDLGFLWNVNKKYPKLPMNPKVGFVIRNINSPKFDQPDSVGGTYKLNRQARLGFALQPAKFWNLALDIDATKNKTAVNGFDSQQLAFGTEINIINRKYFNIPLRAGICKNMAEESSKMAYTLGTGVNACYMHFDVAGAISSDSTTMDDKEIPAKVLVSAVLGILW